MKVQGFTLLEHALFDSQFIKWKRDAYHISIAGLRRLRAIAILEGANPDEAYPVETYKQHLFLETLKQKDNQ